MAISRAGVMAPHSRLSSLSAVRTRSRMADCTASVRAQMPPAAGLFTVRPDPPACAAWPSTAAPPSDTATILPPFSARLSAARSTPSVSTSAACTV